MRWVGLIAATATIGLAILTSDGPLVFVNVPGLVFVLAVGGGVIATAHGVRGLALLIRSLFQPVRTDRTEVRNAALTGKQAFVAAGWIGVLIGAIQILSALDDPAQIGTGAALVLLIPMYGYLLAYLFCMPLERSLSAELE